MTSPDLRPDDHETLSALFDGELGGDARLFALRRLGHDATWQDRCGRWQLIGDAMRRQAPLAAPEDFAARVSASLATARSAPATAHAPAARSGVARRMRWIGGGAIAASVALAVVFSSLPGERAAPVSAQPVLASTAPASTPAIEPPVRAAPRATAAVPASPQPEAAPRAARRQAPAPRVLAAAPTPATTRAQAVPTGAERSSAVPPVSEATLLVGRSGNPFNLSGDDALAVRPWPRAAAGTASGAFTARYGTAGDSEGERPSFYPFVPRPQGEPEQAPPP